MDCSRCGGDLEVYSLGEEEAYVCADCGFVDTPVDHEVSTQPDPEPWERALRRFYEKHVDGDAAIVGSGETAALVEIDRSQKPAVVPTDDTGAEHATAGLVGGGNERTAGGDEADGEDEASSDPGDEETDEEAETGDESDADGGTGEESDADDEADASEGTGEQAETDDESDADDGTAGDEQAA
ncbi:hypothetical protein [Halapricum desulfuricans]|uniref:Zn finger domain containing protein n=1 Tax=Halapricum desulfuricans TaxID=2841257 RepID=A0A897P0P6_9EURY|nr:hypothetical protein [Halapricum desulfuricans]QSG15836.1 Zn finger domain containing protein [Halapricum desulfuricans]